MAEFDDKLNSLLSNPEAMDQIMKMAQSLMGNGHVSAEWPRQQGDGAELGPAQPGKPKPVSQRACGERSAGA